MMCGLYPGNLGMCFSCPSLCPVGCVGSSPCLTSFCPCSGQVWDSLGTFLYHCPIPSLLREGVSLHSSWHQCPERGHGSRAQLGSQSEEMGFLSAFCSKTSTQQMTRPNCIYRAARIFQPFCKTRNICQAGGSRWCFLSQTILDLLSCPCFKC